MNLSHQFPSHKKGQQTRAAILTAIESNPQANLVEIASATGRSTSQVRRQLKFLRIAGLVGTIAVLTFVAVKISYAGAFIANAIVATTAAIETVEVESDDDSSEEPETITEDSADA